MSTGSILGCLQGLLGCCEVAAGHLWVRCFGRSQPSSLPAPRPTPTVAPVVVLRPTAKPVPRRPRFAVAAQPESVVHLFDGHPRHIPVIPIETGFEWELLGAKTAASLSALLPAFLEPHLDNPTLASVDEEWTPRARLVRAYRAGVSAARVCRGAFHKQAKSPSIPFDNFIYVVLQCREYPEGFCTTSFATYIEIVGGPAGLDPISVSHGFPTRVEVLVFLQGAQRQWPIELLAQEES